MLQEQILFYIREYGREITFVAESIALLILVILFFQVMRMRRETHEICKKIRAYFEVVMQEEEPKAGGVEKGAVIDVKIPSYQAEEMTQLYEEERKKAADAGLLMEIIQEVF